VTTVSTNPCRSCGQEIDADPGERCDACEHRARHEVGEFVILIDGRLLCPTRPDDPMRPEYVFPTVYEAERMAQICYPGLSHRTQVQRRTLGA
jgi:hypothetical protein